MGNKQSLIKLQPCIPQIILSKMTDQEYIKNGCKNK